MHLGWRLKRLFAAAPPHSPDLRGVVRSALQTRLYRPYLVAAGLGSPGRIDSVPTEEELLDRLPIAHFPVAPMSPSALSNPWMRSPDPVPLFWPIPAPARAAVLKEGFQQTHRLRVIHPRETGRLRHFAPEALAGPVSELRRLAEPPLHCPRWIPRLSHSLLALLFFPQVEISAETRDLLWRSFGVPLFSQILSPSGHLLAWECEARQGYHIHTRNAVFELLTGSGAPELLVTCLTDLGRPLLRLAAGVTAEISRQRCGCGQDGPRLVGLAHLRQRIKPRAMAAAASCAAD